MLTARSTARMRAAAIALGLAASAAFARGARAQDDEPDDALRRPDRLTVGVADELLGQLAPDGQTLYFVSNRNTASQIFVQNVADGRAHQLFDDGADVTWPRVSSDGKHLLYISFGERATGQLCVRDLPEGGNRRCLDDPSTPIQAEWIDRERIAVVARKTIAGDLGILEVSTKGKLEARPLLDRNLSTPTVSPDGRWIAYVPIERTEVTVGPAFAAHASNRLEAARLDAPSAPPVPLVIDLPGLSGQPAFGPDGRFLYFVQFFADTNHDGVVDASDHGVLYRVPISFASGVPVAGPPEQLTDTSRNCEYPAPHAQRLIATCSKDDSLDIYSMPVDGEVPADWTNEQMDAEIDEANSQIEQQLLASRRLSRETDPSRRRLALLALATTHIGLAEFRAAEFYAKAVAALHDHATAGLSHPLLALVEQRRAAHNRELGRLIGEFGSAARKRLADLKLPPTASALAVAFAHVVRSEIADSVGDKTQAREELEAVVLDAGTPLPIVEAYYARADALYRSLDDREALAATCRRLSEDASLPPDDRLRYASAAVRAMVRGLPYDEAAERLTRERAGAAGDTEIAFALDAEAAVLALREAEPPPAVLERVLSLYGAQGRPGRRKALVNAVIDKATAVHADRVVEAVAQRVIEDVPKGTRERRAVERLYRRVMTGRAYRRAAQKRYAEAQADFDAMVEHTGSYEAVVGAIDMRLKAGESPETIGAAYAKPGMPAALSHFARAYVLARRLPKLEGDEHAKAAAEALDAIRTEWSVLKEKRIAQALDGALLHEEFLRTGDLASVEKANNHYLVALELVGNNARFRAMILGELGLLHVAVGNYRIAVGYLEDRDKLPYTDNSEGLGVHLALARALLHVGRDAEAAKKAEDALAMIDRTPALSKYRVVALDRAAVCHLSAGDFERALALYDEEIPLLDAMTGPAWPHAPRNRFVARVARAAAEVGANQPARAIEDLSGVERELADSDRLKGLIWPNGSSEGVSRTYRVLANGLRAQAYGKLHRLDAAAQAIAVQHTLLLERLKKSGERTDVQRQVLLSEARLAMNAGARNDVAAAREWVTKALATSDDLEARGLGAIDADQLDVLRMAAELAVSMRAPLVPDLSARLEAATKKIASGRNPSLRPYARWLEIYEPLVATYAAP